MILTTKVLHLFTLFTVVVPYRRTVDLRRRTTVDEKKYNYFAYGSNMCLETMTSLRNISPIAWTPAVLPGYCLTFDIPGIPLVEPSWASVEENSLEGSSVHGVLYQLTGNDFASVCRTEGVPLGYNLRRCRVFPYIECNGAKRSVAGIKPVNSLTLCTSPHLRSRPSVNPSQSYLNVLIRGAKEAGLEESYVRMLKEIRPSPTLLGGTSEGILRFASRFSTNSS